jgi:hypothetical protein
MELLINPQSSYLLQTDLASLHAESKAWLDEINFWQDELAFLYKLLHSKLSSDAYPSSEISGFDKQLVSINSECTDKLKVEVESHERDLAMVLQTTSMSKEDKYRMAHRDLRIKMEDTHYVVRGFKKEVYAFVRKYETK